MPDVQFNEENYAPVARTSASAAKGSAFSRLMIKTGLAKDEAGAQKAMLVIAIVCIVLAIAVIVLGGHHSAPAPVPAQPGMSPV